MTGKYVSLLSGLFFILLLTGCAEGMTGTKFSVIPLAAPESGVRTTLSHGQVVAIKSKKNDVAVYVSEGQLNPDLSTSLYVALNNKSSHPVNIHINDISLFALTGDDKIPLTKYSKHEVMFIKRQQYQTQAAFQVLAGALSSFSASYNASHRYYSGTVRGYVGSTPVYGTYTATVYDPYAGQLAGEIENMKTQQSLQNIYARQHADMFRLDRVLFDSLTLEPGQDYAGVIEIKPSNYNSLDKLLLEVSFDKEIYAFEYAVMTNRKI